ncbi:MAG TPA: ribonuclease Y [Candidatus Magasanikbacteria bacterium]|nr:ribonuclease Y [Candidatus Magasanikbacteria bacterium]
MTILTFVLLIVGLGLGFGVGYAIRTSIGKNKTKNAEANAEKLIAEAKIKQHELIVEAKEKAIKALEEVKQEEKRRREELKTQQTRLETRENTFDKKILELQEKQQKLNEQIEMVKQKAEEVRSIRDEAVKKLEHIAAMTREQAQDELFSRIEKDSKEALSTRIMKLQNENSEYFEKQAKKIIGTAIQRIASSHAADATTTAVDLPNEEMKGRIIGKEGRNIKTIERLTGCELVIDETPGVILVSGFSPIRRQVARLTLEKLIADGRIQPARIESFIEESKKELAIDIKKAGEQAIYELGITGIDPKLVNIIGRLKYRYSYGQNNMVHSLEVARLSGLIAEELGEDPVIARKAGFLHDIGKAVDHETPGGHPEIGYTILKKFGFSEDIAYCCIAHHEDNPKTLLGAIVKAGDAISGGRPGARKGTYEEYIHRLEELENIANSFAGVEKTYAIQAGREVRVFVRPGEVDDYQAYNLAKDIARKIESDLSYPGELKVMVIRETRIVEYAK